MTSLEEIRESVFLTGPTASGKTALGVALANRLGAEIIAMDSMTLYRGLDIGTAKPTLAERQGVPHHLIDVLAPWESASVAMYRAWALEKVREVRRRGRRALFVGGTPLYLKALLRGLFTGPPADPEIRRRLESEADAQGDRALHDRLSRLDPTTARRLHPNDRRRVVRALEVLERTGQPISVLQAEHDRPAEGATVLALEHPRELLHERINHRVERMFEAGLVEEVRRLLSGPRPLHPVPSRGIGYLEVIDLLQGRLTEVEAIQRTQARTRQLAKRQATWFRGLVEVRPWPVDAGESLETIADQLAVAVEGRIGAASPQDPAHVSMEELDQPNREE